MNLNLNKRELGAKKEAAAADYLASRGYLILERNYRTRFGEIDLIALDGQTLCFIEVKFRTSMVKGSPGESITPGKMSRIRRCAMSYMSEKHYYEDTPCRFDVVLIPGEQFNLIKDAFS